MAELRLGHRGFDCQSRALPNCLRPGASEESDGTSGGEWVVRTASRGTCTETGAQVTVAGGRQGWARANLLLGRAWWGGLSSVDITMLPGTSMEEKSILFFIAAKICSPKSSVPC